jgi:alanine-glyoxylate transaminase/serine-glyoxylate transaminase/serine-pyruvate transaminase
MLPPGIGFNAISPRALEAAKTATLPRAFWSWEEIVAMNADGYWPTTPNTNLLYGLNEALEMLLGEGLDNVFARHQRWAEAFAPPSTPGSCRSSASSRRADRRC